MVHSIKSENHMYVGCYFVTPFKFISGYEVQPKHKEGFLFSVGGHKAGLNRILYYQIHQDDLEELKISEIADFNVNYLPLFLRDCVKDRSFYDYTEELEKSRLKDVKHVVENKENDIIYRMNYAQGVLMDWENVVDSLILEDMKKIRYENIDYLKNFIIPNLNAEYSNFLDNFNDEDDEELGV